MDSKVFGVARQIFSLLPLFELYSPFFERDPALALVSGHFFRFLGMIAAGAYQLSNVHLPYVQLSNKSMDNCTHIILTKQLSNDLLDNCTLMILTVHLSEVS